MTYKIDQTMTDMSQISDGRHTFAELYEYRMLYNALAANAMPDKAMKCWRHSDGELCFGGGFGLLVHIASGLLMRFGAQGATALSTTQC